MKYFIVLALCLSAAIADHPLDLQARVNSIHDIHYSQHSQTVDDAKRIVRQKLGSLHASATDAGQQVQSSLEEVDSYGVGTVGASSGYSGSGSSGSGYSGSYSASSGSQSGNQQVLQENYDGVGLGVGVDAGSSAQQSASSSRNSGLGQVVIPVGSGGSESYAEQSERRVASGGSSPVVITSPVAGSESYSHHQESRIQNQAAPIYVSSPSGGSESYSHHEERRVQNQAAPVYIAPSGGSESYSHHEERRVQNQAAPVIVAPIGGSESFSRQEERRIQNQAAPLYISSPSVGSESYTHHQERIQQAAIPTVYTAPSVGSESYSHHRAQRIQSQSVPVIYSSPSGTSEAYSHRSEKVVQSQPASIYFAPSAGSESYSKMSKFSSQSQAAPLVIMPTSSSVGLSSHSSLLNTQSQILPVPAYLPSQNYYDRLSEDVSSSQIAPTYSTIIAPGADASEYSFTHKSSKSQARPSIIYSSPVSNSHSSFTSSQSSRNAASNLVPIVTGLGVSGSLLNENRLYGTNNLHTISPTFGSTGFGSSGLSRYMTESERLARIQAQDVGFGGFRSGSSQLNLDGGFDSSNLALSNADGGYRSKSWEKSSKWSSGSQFGPDGRPKTYNHLSTAESENHDINGRQAGYKAATTTLDDNGKVSTYSIHS